MDPVNELRIQKLKERIADLKQRWPAHSIPPALMLELDELEDELARALEQGQQDEKDA